MTYDLPPARVSLLVVVGWILTLLSYGVVLYTAYLAAKGRGLDGELLFILIGTPCAVASVLTNACAWFRIAVWPKGLGGRRLAVTGLVASALCVPIGYALFAIIIKYVPIGPLRFH
jgi:hypothetical protein